MYFCFRPHAATSGISGDFNDEKKDVSQNIGKRKQDEAIAPEQDDSDDSKLKATLSCNEDMRY